MPLKKLYFTAGEPSGDLFAAEVIDALRSANDTLSIRAVGGVELAARCDTPSIDTGALNVLGFWEGIKAYGDVQRISSEIASDVLKYKPDAVVLVDSWGLSLRIAKKVRAVDASIRLIKLIGPQVWASRAGRAKTLAASVDHLLCMHEFEAPYYDAYNLPVTVVGQPALSRAERFEGHPFRKRHGIDEEANLILLLPGSRRAEIDLVAEPLVEAAKILGRDYPNLVVCVAPALTVEKQFYQRFGNLPEHWIRLPADENRYEAMAAATLALSCSGTVNTELAVQRTPFITGYKIGAASWFLLKNFFLKAEYITLLNMAAGKMVAPEFLQNAFNAEVLAREAGALLASKSARKRQMAEQDEALMKMGYGHAPAATLAAEAIFSDIVER